MNRPNRIADRVASIMRAEEHGRHRQLERVLHSASLLYGTAAAARGSLYRNRLRRQRRLPCLVISIGNLTVGGTGKTPMTLYTAGHLRQLGYRVAVISRGYRGSAGKKGGIVSDGRRIRMGPEAAGDEPYMMATRLTGIPVVVGRNRFAAGMLAVERFAPHVVVLDDGFQHLRLFRDLDLVLLDSRRPLGNGHLLPRGILREPVSALTRCDACIFTRSNAAAPARHEQRRIVPAGHPFFSSVHLPKIYEYTAGDRPGDAGRGMPALVPRASDYLSHRSVFAFSGIADNPGFRQTLRDLGCSVSDFTGFPDHHRYSGADLEDLLGNAKKRGADMIVTTEKDFARIGHRIRWRFPMAVVGIETAFGADRSSFHEFIENRMDRGSGLGCGPNGHRLPA